MALFLDVEAGDAVHIGDGTVVRLEQKSGKRARLRIESSADVKHVRAGEETAPSGLQRSVPTPETAPAVKAPGQSVFHRRRPVAA